MAFANKCNSMITLSYMYFKHIVSLTLDQKLICMIWGVAFRFFHICLCLKTRDHRPRHFKWTGAPFWNTRIKCWTHTITLNYELQADLTQSNVKYVLNTFGYISHKNITKVFITTSPWTLMISVKTAGAMITRNISILRQVHQITLKWYWSLQGHT